MKTISKIAILTGVGLLFVGCSGSTPNTPESLPLNNQKELFIRLRVIIYIMLCLQMQKEELS